MSNCIHPKDEWRAKHAISLDEFAATDPTYRELYNRVHDEPFSAAECAKFYIDHTTTLAAGSESGDFDHFVEAFGGSILELAARTHYQDDAIRLKLVDLVHELQKVVMTDPKSDSGKPLCFYEGHEGVGVLWKDLPGFWLACAEERISFVATDPTNTPWEIERWKNLTAFWAAQTRFPATNHSVYAIAACRDAFGQHEPDDEVGNRTFLLQTSCLWLVYGIDWIWPLVHGHSEFWEREQWDRWKEGLQDSKDFDGEEETRILVAKALVAMEKAEGGTR